MIPRIPYEEGDVVLKLQSVAPKKSYAYTLKWDRNQPRIPGGSGKESGRWTRGGVSQGLGSVPEGTKPIGDGTGPLMEQLEKRRNRVLGSGGATYGDIMRAPMGTGFGNQPRITGDPEVVKRLTTLPPPKANSAVVEALTTGDVTRSEELEPGEHTNKVFSVTLDDTNKTEAVLKPESGERWDIEFANTDISSYITNRRFSLAEREATAFEISEALGLGIVPETVSRESIGGVDASSMGVVVSQSNTWDVKDEYDQYKQKAQEDAIDKVGEEMWSLWDEHLQNAKGRQGEIQKIWEKIVAENPDRIGAAEAAREHPTLPMGTEQAFERKTPEPVDMNEVFKYAAIDPDGRLSADEKEDVEKFLREKIEAGAEELGELDEDKYRDDKYDDWLSAHSDTEGKLYAKHVKTFESWKEAKGYGSGHIANDQAPHPDGGMLQKFVDGLSTSGTMTPEETRKLAVFDYVVGTMDRHGHNVFFDDDGRMVALDNGYTFPSAPADDPDSFTFRSDPVRQWSERRGVEHMPEEERMKIASAIAKTDWKAFMERHPNMNDGERESLKARLENVLLAMQDDYGLKRLWNRLNVM